MIRRRSRAGLGEPPEGVAPGPGCQGIFGSSMVKATFQTLIGIETVSTTWPVVSSRRIESS